MHLFPRRRRADVNVCPSPPPPPLPQHHHLTPCCSPARSVGFQLPIELVACFAISASLLIHSLFYPIYVRIITCTLTQTLHIIFPTYCPYTLHNVRARRFKCLTHAFLLSLHNGLFLCFLLKLVTFPLFPSLLTVAPAV